MAEALAPRSAPAIGNAGTKICMASVPVNVSSATSQSGIRARGGSVAPPDPSLRAWPASFMSRILRRGDRAADMPKHPDRRRDVGAREPDQHVLVQPARARL